MVGKMGRMSLPVQDDHRTMCYHIDEGGQVFERRNHQTVESEFSIQCLVCYCLAAVAALS